ncbi:hypothetical protein [Streptomyces sp. NPDC090093]|uniref:hypothetical protein n=1 Tax=Streptomyces sp. NPDC090093 TaxID=3365945 RepID=UPI0038050D4F
MKYRTNRRVVAAVLISTAVTTLAACGPAGTGADSKSSADAGGPSPSTPGPGDSFDSLSGPQISEKIKSALRRTTSVRLTGDLPQPGTGAGGTFTVDITMDTTGACRGTIAMPGAGVLNLIKGRGNYFVQGDERYWRTSLAAGKNKPSAQKVDAFLPKVKDRWLKVNEKTAKAFASSSMCDLSAITKQIERSSPGDVERGADVTRDGQELAVIYDRSGNEVTTAYVSKGARPYLVELTSTGGTAPVNVKFTDYGKPVDTTPPPAAQIITPEKLGLVPNRRA